jgi:pimeloyl-ACP methyl ester carboxylesterase
LAQSVRQPQSGVHSERLSRKNPGVFTFILVPGACHGGWWYEPVVERLEQDGHRAISVTLAGLEDEPRIDRLITLTTHVDQVRDLVPSTGPVVLVGHSYAGSVVTAVADRMPERISGLVFLDAFLPHDGDSCWAMTNDEQRTWYATGCASTGYGVDPLPFFSGRARPHPVATLLQALRLRGRWQTVPIKHYVAAQWPGESPMALSIQRADADSGIAVHHWDVRHNVLADGPDRVIDLLRTLPGYFDEAPAVDSER